MFDFNRFLHDHFVTPKGLIAFLNAYGAEAPGLPAAEKWFQRGAIPGGWLPHLLAYLELDRGEPVRLAKYLISV